MKKPLLVINLSGFGINIYNRYNPINFSNLKCLKYLFSNYPFSKLDVSSTKNGLAPTQVIDNKLGHLALSYGNKLFYKESYISSKIEDLSFFENDTLASCFKDCRINSKNVHIVSLLSRSNKISSFNHLINLLKMGKMYGLQKMQILIDLIIDDIDSNKENIINLINSLNEVIKNEGIGIIHSISGKVYGINKAKNYLNTKIFIDNLFHFNELSFTSVIDEINRQRFELSKVSSYYSLDNLLPCHIDNNDYSLKRDEYIIFNTSYNENFQQFFDFFYNKGLIDRAYLINNFDRYNISLITYFPTSIRNIKYCFEGNDYTYNLGKLLSDNNLFQLRISDSFSYEYLNEIFDGFESKSYKNTTRINIDLGKINLLKDYYLKDDVIYETLISNLDKKIYDFSIITFSGIDIYGHLANFKCLMNYMENLDLIIEKIYKYTQKHNINLVILSDHSNGDRIAYNSLKPNMLHTSSSVPFCLINNSYNLKPNGNLIDVAPTLAELLDLDYKTYFTSESLIVKD